MIDIFILANTRSYLMQHHSGYYIKALAAEETLTTICISYLTFGCFAPFLSEENLQERVLRGDFALQEYAVCYWLHHLKEFLHRENRSRSSSSAIASAVENLHESHVKHSLALGDSQAIYPKQSEMPVSQVLPRLLEIYEKIDTIRANELDPRKRPSEFKFVARLKETQENKCHIYYGVFMKRGLKSKLGFPLGLVRSKCSNSTARRHSDVQ
jgi:hypothetical protein